MTAEESPAEKAGAQPDEETTAESGEEPQRSLNRAERRALAHGKKGGNAGSGQGDRFGGFPSPGRRGPGSFGKSNLPRTGHK
ncbi:MAG TPA: hypothetical protein VGS41_03885 [Chthonomonadales bacterium]|nr:hypothetical protein [Chthonomonadales bacterium]